LTPDSQLQTPDFSRHLSLITRHCYDLRRRVWRAVVLEGRQA